MTHTSHNDELFARAQLSIPGGVNSPVRAFRSVGGTPLFLVKAAGAYVTDSDGRDYVDLVSSWGPAILGHAHPAVVSAVQDAAALGLSFGASTPGETVLAELIKGRVGAIEKLRLVSTGTEATMTAIRLARGFTQRDLLSSSPATTTATPTVCSPRPEAAWPPSRCPARPASPRPPPRRPWCCRTTTWAPCAPRSRRTPARSPR